MPKINRSLDYKNPPRLSSYRDGAARRGLAFELDAVSFKAISAQACHYCGKAGPNGIDRRDNAIGYTVANCLPACLQCNYAKGSHDYEVFVGYLNRLAQFQKSKML